MLPLARAALLEFVVHSYRSLDPEMRPPYVWVREYDSVHFAGTGEAFPTMMWAHRVWLLSETGLQARNSLDWRRFELIHCQNFTPRPNPIWNGQIHELTCTAVVGAILSDFWAF